MPPGPPGESFDERVFAAAAALAERGVSAPHALFFLGTGAGVLPGRLEEARRIPLSLAPGVPAAWGEALLHYGELNSLPVWVIEDAPADADDGEPAWAAAFPVWLAAAAGAVSLVHTAAGSALDLGADSLALGTLALVSDHLNLSGATPLIGLGKTRLGPMFPDQTTLHDRRLRAQALAIATEPEVNALGYQHLGERRVDDAIALFRQNVRDYPRSWNVYDSLGEALAVKGNKREALAMYQKALDLSPPGQHGRIRSAMTALRFEVCRKRTSGAADRRRAARA